MSSRSKEREVAARLARHAREEGGEPPPELLARLEGDIPETISGPLRRLEPAHAGAGPAASRRWLLAASLAVMVGAGVLAHRLFETVPPPGMKQPDQAAPPAAPSAAAWSGSEKGAVPAGAGPAAQPQPPRLERQQAAAAAATGSSGVDGRHFLEGPPGGSNPGVPAAAAPSSPREEVASQPVAAPAPVKQKAQVAAAEPKPGRERTRQQSAPAAPAGGVNVGGNEAGRQSLYAGPPVGQPAGAVPAAGGQPAAPPGAGERKDAVAVEQAAGFAEAPAPPAAPAPPPASAPKIALQETRRPQAKALGAAAARPPSAPPPGSFASRGGFVETAALRTSVFGPGAGTPSYDMTRHFVLDLGKLPSPGLVRVEDFVNALGGGVSDTPAGNGPGAPGTASVRALGYLSAGSAGEGGHAAFPSPRRTYLLRFELRPPAAPAAARNTGNAAASGSASPVPPTPMSLAPPAPRAEVEFNPAVVARYRVVSADLRLGPVTATAERPAEQLSAAADEFARSASVNPVAPAAAAAPYGGAMVALYEVELQPGVDPGQASQPRPSGRPGRPAAAAGSASLAAPVATLRYAGSGGQSPRGQDLRLSDLRQSWQAAPAELRLSYLAVELAEALGVQGARQEHADWQGLLRRARALAADLPDERRARELVRLVERAAALAKLRDGAGRQEP
ncbi:MAG TPA: hypothetical protein VHR45_04360 [Thermoanaerobaculia bacterium]|nr:hypothetical protein [Thermoanaerobaculia bacterium]